MPGPGRSITGFLRLLRNELARWVLLRVETPTHAGRLLFSNTFVRRILRKAAKAKPPSGATR